MSQQQEFFETQEEYQENQYRKGMLEALNKVAAEYGFPQLEDLQNERSEETHKQRF